VVHSGTVSDESSPALKLLAADKSDGLQQPAWGRLGLIGGVQ
jgi:hypothetical protein